MCVCRVGGGGGGGGSKVSWRIALAVTCTYKEPIGFKSSRFLLRTHGSLYMTLCFV